MFVSWKAAERWTDAIMELKKIMVNAGGQEEGFDAAFETGNIDYLD